MKNNQSGFVSKRLAFSVFLISVGIIVGIVLVSRLPVLHFEQAASKQFGREEAILPPPMIPRAPDRTDQPFVAVAKSVIPAVVNVSSSHSVQDRRQFLSPFNDPFFKYFFDQQPPRQNPHRERKEQSLGSGVIVSSDGRIVTNSHVVPNVGDKITVLLGDKRTFTAKILGSDSKSDVAVIKIDAENLPFVPWGNSDNLEVGEYVLAVGSPFGFNQTVTMGVVSAVGRANVGINDYESFIQTDAAINPGNSGGALVNTRGELIGINTAIYTQSGGYMGIGFAIPSNMARPIAESLIKTGKVIRGWIGVSIQDLSESLSKEFGVTEPYGSLVGDVVSGGPADQAGIKRGDVIINFMGNKIKNTAALRNKVAQTPVGTSVVVQLIRNKVLKTVTVHIQPQPKDMSASVGAEGDNEENDGEGAKSDQMAGVSVKELTPDIARQLGLNRNQKGLVVIWVEPQSAAEEGGLQRNDLIMEVNRRPVTTLDDYESALSKIPNRGSVLLLVSRDEMTLFITIASP